MHVICVCVCQMLTQHGEESACFLGHSYGTNAAAWMCKYAPEVVDRCVCVCVWVCVCECMGVCVCARVCVCECVSFCL